MRAVSDVLSLSVPLPTTAYPSVNSLGGDGFRGGKKTVAYHALFDAVKAAAEAEMARTGWETADFLVDATLVLVTRSARIRDASNCGKCEMDALTAAGVWLDDALARPWRTDCENDPSGPDRVVIVVRRRYPIIVPRGSPMVANTRRRRPASIPPGAIVPLHDPRGTSQIALVNGRAVPLEDALRDLGLPPRRSRDSQTQS